MDRSLGRRERISCFRPAAVVVEGDGMSRRRSGMEAEKRTVRGRMSVSVVVSGGWRTGDSMSD